MYWVTLLKLLSFFGKEFPHFVPAKWEQWSSLHRVVIEMSRDKVGEGTWPRGVLKHFNPSPRSFTTKKQDCAECTHGCPLLHRPMLRPSTHTTWVRAFNECQANSSSALTAQELWVTFHAGFLEGAFWEGLALPRVSGAHPGVWELVAVVAFCCWFVCFKISTSCPTAGA